MTTYFISDTHFWHDEMRLPTYENRPFPNVESMNKHMIDKWNSVVKQDDVVIHGGDFSLYSSRDMEKELLKQLNGQKYIVMGSHDGSKTRLLDDGFDKVMKYYFDLEKNFLVWHNPWTIPKEMYSEFKYILYGHSHSKISKLAPNFYNISVEVLDYTPRTLEEVIEINNKYKKQNKKKEK